MASQAESKRDLTPESFRTATGRPYVWKSKDSCNDHDVIGRPELVVHALW